MTDFFNKFELKEIKKKKIQKGVIKFYPLKTEEKQQLNNPSYKLKLKKIKKKFNKEIMINNIFMSNVYNKISSS